MQVDVSDMAEWAGDFRSVLTATWEQAADGLDGSRALLRLDCPDPSLLYGSGHHHLVPEFFVQLQGSSRFTVPASLSRTLVAPALLLVPPGVVHEEDMAPGSANLVAKIIDGSLHVHRSRREGRQPMRRCQHDVVDLQACSLPAPTLTEAARLALPEGAPLLRRLVGVALRLLARASTAARAEVPDGPLQRCRDRALPRLADPTLGVAALAAACGCHPDHLSRLARRHWGCSLSAWLTARRLERAQALLADPSREIRAIAALCGFADPRYFARVFRRACGCTPTAFRRALRQG